MSKLKTFSRDDVLEKSITVFWEKGYADTSIQDLENATDIKTSSLYAEFKNKEDLFMCSLDHYARTCDGADLLDAKPLGFHNIEKFLRTRASSSRSRTGCFIINSMREHGVLSPKSQVRIEKHVSLIRASFFKNIAAEKTRTAPEKVTEILMTFFAGMALNDNLRHVGAQSKAPIDEVMFLLKTL